jgi:hypothetical protein
MGDLATYSLRHFIPFSHETYVRLFERMHAEVWPAQWIALGLVGCAVGGIWRGQRRLAAAGVLGGAWGCAAVFFAGPYAELVWASAWFAAGFVAMGAAAAVAVLRGSLPDDRSRRFAAVLFGMCVSAAFVWPVVSGLGVRATEVYGFTPDATAIGVIAAVGNSRSRVAIVPVGIALLWLGASAATWWALGDPAGLVLPVLGLAAGIAHGLRRAIC